ncbi:MAG: hypothetical protein BGO13_11035 [Burkholderiales bacterium 66-5]|uniref:copper chaperone PCu(A)C n=1 Tax=Comamonas badia TaxID=265291 RepID=UPI000403C533|nr:copper chaperone PCu(A)C [Comamonas badia]OJU86643.1 MAG: hypothetical protein BGO13_11035 [Burkholderiales bacterium 66-5]
MPSYLLRSAIAALACAAAGAFAQQSPITISGAWVRATVPGQGGTGAFMTLQSPQALELVGASTPVAGVTQVHEMKLEGNTMRMQHLSALALPAHQSVTLTPGGNHIMLMDLKQPLAAGSTIPITLQLKDAAGAAITQTLQVPVLQQPPAGAAPAAAHGHHGS